MNIIITEEFENRVNLQKASDSFKRACFNWGIGRELYTAPFIFIPADRCNIDNGKCYDRFSVEKIRIDRKRITGLSIRNDTLNCRCFVWTQKSHDEEDNNGINS